MNYHKIDTDRTKLIACTKEILHAALTDQEQLSLILNAHVPPKWTHFGLQPFQHALHQLTSIADQNWWTYFPVHKKDNLLIGTCGYKGKPDATGLVEIGYEIIDHYQNQGLATEIAQALIKHAFANNKVEIVQAHTLAQENASVAVLKKCGMQQIMELIDEEDGKIWRWHLYRSHTAYA